MKQFLKDMLKKRREAKADTVFDPKVIEAQHQYINSPQFYFSLGRMGSRDTPLMGNKNV